MRTQPVHSPYTANGPLTAFDAYARAMNMDTVKLEEQIAHLTRTVEDLSDVVARQEQVIARMERRIQLLLTREAERERDGEIGASEAPADQRPPHW